MDKIRVDDIIDKNIQDLCQVCVPSEKRDDPYFVKGVEEKRRWAVEMLHKWGPFAKLAYQGSTAIGLIQYKPVPDERVVFIYCIYIPDSEHWRKGAANQLLSRVIEEMEEPKAWFGDQPPLALVTETFPGERPGQYPAHRFFTQKGFKQAGENPDVLYFPLREDFVYRPACDKKEVEYIPQEEDKGKALIIHGSSSCPYSYPFLKIAEESIRMAAPEIPIRWIDHFQEPEEASRRGLREGCVVNAKPIKTFVLEKEGFREEVSRALKDS